MILIADPFGGVGVYPYGSHGFLSDWAFQLPIFINERLRRDGPATSGRTGLEGRMRNFFKAAAFRTMGKMFISLMVAGAALLVGGLTMLAIWTVQ
jgi:hypothetical protein